MWQLAHSCGKMIQSVNVCFLPLGTGREDDGDYEGKWSNHDWGEIHWQFCLRKNIKILCNIISEAISSEQ